MNHPYPPIEPFDAGYLDVGDDEIYWECSGNPVGKPAIWLHGGPGGGLGTGGYRRNFDPDRYLIVGIDQRGVGRSRPTAAEPGLGHGELLGRLARNTTADLISDIEAVRRHLGIERWLVSGGSWGSTLGLAYAQAHVDRVTEIVLVAITTGSPWEIDWITETVGAVFPEEWDRFASTAHRLANGDVAPRLVDTYARLLTDPDPHVREQASIAWCRWEDVHVSLATGYQPNPRYHDVDWALNFATLVTHYWSNDCFMGDEVLGRMPIIAHLPGVLVHGRLDVSGPVRTAWRVHQAWPSSELVVVEAEAHGGPTMANALTAATDRFAVN